MSAYYSIADAVKTLLATVTGIPGTIYIRKDDALYGRDTVPLCIVSMPDEDGQTAFETFGTDNSTDLGTVGKVYRIGVSVYRSNTGDLSSTIDTNPSLILAIKQKIGKPKIISTVTDYAILGMHEWEVSEFKNGAEVSRILMSYTNAEARNG